MKSEQQRRGKEKGITSWFKKLYIFFFVIVFYDAICDFYIYFFVVI